VLVFHTSSSRLSPMDFVACHVQVRSQARDASDTIACSYPSTSMPSPTTFTPVHMTVPSNRSLSALTMLKSQKMTGHSRVSMACICMVRLRFALSCEVVDEMCSLLKVIAGKTWSASPKLQRHLTWRGIPRPSLTTLTPEFIFAERSRWVGHGEAKLS
jgi:hypothetical protein